MRELDDAATAEVALIENVQRDDLNAIEEAEGYKKLILNFAHSQDEVGKLVGKSRSHVANLLRLLDLPDDVRATAAARRHQHGACPRHRDLAARLGHRRADRPRRPVGAPGRATGARRPARPRSSDGNGAAPRPVDADLAALERQLGDLLGLRVKVAHGKGGGTVALHYSSLDQLDMICQRLSGEPI